MSIIKLSNAQVEDLARPLAKTITEFYENPDNQRKFIEWHIKKYGCEPIERK